MITSEVELVCTGEAGRRLGVSAEMVRKWCAASRPGYVVDSSGRRLVLGDSLRDLLEERQASKDRRERA